MDVFKNIFSIQNHNRHKVIRILGFKIKIKDWESEISLLRNDFEERISQMEYLNTRRMIKMLPVNSIKLIETHIVDHCNLNCKGCQHFAPLSPKSFLSLSEFERDLKRLFELTNGEISIFNILGGEPLLHPQCMDFLETARKIFPKSTIRLITNGILLPGQPDSFYEKCAKNNICLQPTKYNIDIDWELVKQKCKKYGVYFKFYLDNSIMYKDTIDLTNSQPALYSFLNCQLGWNECFYLHHGKIYHCSKTAYLKIFDDYFKKNISVQETDYIDIYKVNNVREIYDFMNTPPKFCSHCIRNGEFPTYVREESKKDISEWT